MVCLPWSHLTADKCDPNLSFALTLADLPDHCQALIEELVRQRAGLISKPAADDVAKNERLVAALEQAAATAQALMRRIESIDKLAGQFFDEMQFGFLLDPARQLLSIGYQSADGALDPSCYDLLASEARLASFIAIAKGDIAPKHWFKLGRAVTPIDRGSALISWSGSMFEYLMPELVMREPEGSLLHQTARLIVSRQIEYGAQLGVPWGISESAYNFRDLELTYQYSNFGVPGLGLKRGLSENMVVAPYATALASMIEPAAAVRNFSRLADMGGCGRYGWYEALDYTPGRIPEGKSVAVVRAYMAHHQGMSLVAIANTLLRRDDADALSCQSDRAGDRAFAAGKAAARCRRQMGACRRSEPDDAGTRTRAAHVAPVPLAARSCPAQSSSVERPLCRHDHRRWVGVQPLAQSRRIALARRHHLRSLGVICLSARCRKRLYLVCGLSAERR